MNGSRLGAAIAVGLILVIGGGAAWLYADRAGPFKDSAPAASDLSRFARGEMKALEVPAKVEPAPDYVFHARDGAETRFADFRGKVVVVNLWAMWCAPCREEMPTLAALARAYPDGDVVVLPINVDVGDEALGKATAFIADQAPLPLYTDEKFQLPFEFPGKGKMPQTVLLDRQGRVRAVLSGGADWSGPDAKALIEALRTES